MSRKSRTASYLALRRIWHDTGNRRRVFFPPILLKPGWANWKYRIFQKNCLLPTDTHLLSAFSFWILPSAFHIPQFQISPVCFDCLNAGPSAATIPVYLKCYRKSKYKNIDFITKNSLYLILHKEQIYTKNNKTSHTNFVHRIYNFLL